MWKGGVRNHSAHAKVNCSFARRTLNYLLTRNSRIFAMETDTIVRRTHSRTHIHTRTTEAAIAMASSAAATGSFQTISLNSSQDTLSLVAHHSSSFTSSSYSHYLLLMHLSLTPIRTTHLLSAEDKGFFSSSFAESRRRSGGRRTEEERSSAEIPGDAH